MRKRTSFMFLALIACLCLSGCWDRRELEKLGLVQMLGLDFDPASKQPVITTVVAIPSKLGSTQGGGEGGGVVVTTMKAPSIYEGFNLINTTLNREITLQQNELLVIGESYAKHGINHLMDSLARFRDSRRTLLLFICQGKASDILQFEPKTELNPAEFLSDLVHLSNRTAMFPLVFLNRFMNNFESKTQENYAPLLAKYTPPEAEPPKPKEEKPEGGDGGDDKSGKDESKSKKPTAIRLIGTAVFHQSRLVGNLDIYETQILQLLTNRFKEAFVTISDPLKSGYSVVVRLIGGNSTKFNYHGAATGKDRFTVQSTLEADIVSIQSGIDYTEPQNRDKLVQSLAKDLTHRMQKVVQKTQQIFKSDIFGFGVKVRNRMLTTEEWENYGWPQKYPDAKINYQVKVAIRRVGVQFKPPQAR